MAAFDARAQCMWACGGVQGPLPPSSWSPRCQGLPQRKARQFALIMKGLGGSVDGADMVSTVGAAALLTAHSALLSQLLRSAVELLPSKALL